MSEQLATIENLPAIPEQDNAFAQFTRAYLPRLELFSMARSIVKEGKVTPNVFGLVIEKDKIREIGKEADIFVLGYRFAAMDFSDLKKIKICYDEKSAEFKRIQAQSQVKAPEGEMNGCTCGPQFLIVVRDHGFATLMCGGQSWKDISDQIRVAGANRKFGTLTNYIKKRGAFAWQAPDYRIIEGSFGLPPHEDMIRQIEIFKSVEAVEVKDEDLEGDNITVDKSRVV